MSVGIYKITNLITGRIYIGQSRNIERRFIDHNTVSHDSEIIDKNINLYGKENFSYEILELCDISELDKKEIYYIDLYRNNGYNLYNIISGGQEKGSRIGSNNGNAKLTESDVYFIREAYKNHEGRSATYELFKDKISQSAFNSLWEGQYWTSVHMDVYTKENHDYYVGRIFTDEEVYELRHRYMNESPEEIYQSVKNRCSLSTLKKILYGTRYKNIPVYVKSSNKWIIKN